MNRRLRRQLLAFAVTAFNVALIAATGEPVAPRHDVVVEPVRIELPAPAKRLATIVVTADAIAATN